MKTLKTHSHRHALSQAKRIVVKIGSQVLLDAKGNLKRSRLNHLLHDLIELQQQGREILLVTSGAVGLGMFALGKKRTASTSLSHLQMAASIGQTQLMRYYAEAFEKSDCLVSQVLFSREIVKNWQHHLNARHTLEHLLAHRVVPIINENDVMSTHIADNDELACMVAALVHADLLILLTTPNGFLQPDAQGKLKRVPHVAHINEEILQFAVGKTGALSTGGMSSKLKAAQAAVKAGAKVVIASGLQKNVIQRVLQGKDVGTLIGETQGVTEQIKGKKRWLAFFHKSQGEIIIDAGAQRALQEQGKSLLPVGITQVKGKFPTGALVKVLNAHNTLIAHGLVNYSSQEIKKIQGKKASKIMAILGEKTSDEIIHRDKLILREKDDELLNLD